MSLLSDYYKQMVFPVLSLYRQTVGMIGVGPESHSSSAESLVTVIVIPESSNKAHLGSVFVGPKEFGWCFGQYFFHCGH